MGGEWLLGNQGTRMSWLQHNQLESGKVPRIGVTGTIIYLALTILSGLLEFQTCILRLQTLFPTAHPLKMKLCSLG